MQIHQSIPHGLLYSVEPQDFAKFQLSDQASHDNFDWEEYESEYAEETLACNVISFFKELAGE
jgi:hypothetical protein